MEKFRVLVHGQNLLTETDGHQERLGFFTNVYIEAWTLEAAKDTALTMVREDAELAEILLNAVNDPLSLSVEEIQKLESFDSCHIPRDAFFLYPMEGAD